MFKDPLEQELMARQEKPTGTTGEVVDPAITKALELLDPADRPTVPVRLYDDPDKLYEEVLKRFGGDKLSPKAVGVVPYDQSAIYINKRAEEFKDPWMLASKILHEQAHVARPRYDRTEYPSYEREVGFINKYPSRFDINYRNKMLQLLERIRQKEQKK